jgi:hypothetical protein
MEDATNQDNSGSSNLKIYFAAFWLLSIVVAAGVAFFYGKTSNQSAGSNAPNVLSSTNQISVEPTPTTASQIVQVTQEVSPVQDNKTCSKYGFAQKWEYLTAYSVKENDTLESIATKELKDATRTNEIIKINGVGPFVVGYTLYLPPPSVTKSSGNLKQLYGKLVAKNSSSWQVNLSTDPKGQGILIPSFLFETVVNKDAFKVNDCLKIFLDDGFKVYTVSQQ